MPEGEVRFGELDEERFRQAVAIRDWLLVEARKISDPNVILEGLCMQLRRAGVPVDRGVSAVELRHAKNAANARIWVRGETAREHLYTHGDDASLLAGHRPLDEAHRLGRWLVLDLASDKAAGYYMTAELRDLGYTQHVAVPVVLINGMRCGFTFATCNSEGFSPADFEVLRVVMPALAALQELLVLHRILREVLRMYVGREPHERILSGDVVRGEVLKIRAAILFADMRNFTSLTAGVDETRAIALVNEFYDRIVPHVEARGGEVLKFIGDAVLAIFRTQNGNDPEACWRALAAASAALDRAGDDTPSPFEFGIALHLGDPAYGNVGSGARLDYTVIGQDVNLAARISGLCGPLRCSLLVSETFQSLVAGVEFERKGEHALKGFEAAIPVFAPVSSATNSKPAASF